MQLLRPQHPKVMMVRLLLLLLHKLLPKPPPKPLQTKLLLMLLHKLLLMLRLQKNYEKKLKHSDKQQKMQKKLLN